MKNLLVSILLAVAITVASIFAGLLAARSASAQEAESASQADPLQFARGARAWADTCARCHNMRNPQELRDDQWRAVMAHMRIRAGLSGAETRDVLAFLQGSN